MSKTYKTRGKVWLWSHEAGSRHFVNVDPKLSTQLKQKYAKVRRGFGSIPVEATIGKTSWRSSIFPDKKSGTYLLPLKLKVRLAENLSAGDQISFQLKVR